MRYLLSVVLFVGVAWGYQGVALGGVPVAEKAPEAAVAPAPTSGTVVVSKTIIEAPAAVEAPAVKADGAEESNGVMSLLKKTETIVGMITALIVAITGLIVTLKSKATATTAVGVLTKTIELAKANVSQKAVATAIGETVNAAVPRTKSAAGALIHKFVKKAEKKLG